MGEFISKLGGGQLGALQRSPLAAQWIPGHAKQPPSLGQNAFDAIIKSPWLGVGLQAATGTLLLLLALAAEGWAEVAAYLGAAYWYYRAGSGGLKLLRPPAVPALIEV